MIKFKAKRDSLKFEYEFKDGSVEKVEYLSPTTKQIDRGVSLEDDVEARLTFTKEILKECLKAGKGVKAKIIEEQENDSNIYLFKDALDKEMGKLKETE